MKKLKLWLCLVFTAAICCAPLTACVGNNDKQPVAVEIWHAHTGSINIAFENKISEFNATVGKEKNVIVTCEARGNLTQLAKDVLDSANKQPGADAMPDMFFTYADDAYAVDKVLPLCDLKNYFTQSELNDYVEGYIQEGMLGGEALRVFPIAKATELMMVNRTEWDKFEAAVEGVSINDLKTVEGLTKVAEKYYNYCGKALYARDALDNYAFISAVQLGGEVYSIEDGALNLSFTDEIARAEWDNYYVPYMKGHFSHIGKFGTDCIKTGETIVAVGSSSSSAYFPKFVQEDEDSPIININLEVMAAPTFGGSKVYTQQGAGVAVAGGSKEKEAACAEFIRWFTSSEVNIDFAVETGYLPVRKADNDFNKVKAVAEEKNGSADVIDAMKVCLELVASADNMYTPTAFTSSAEIRKYFKDKFASRCGSDVNLIKNGSKTVEELISDAAFEDLYSTVSTTLNGIAHGNIRTMFTVESPED